MGLVVLVAGLGPPVRGWGMSSRQYATKRTKLQCIHLPCGVFVASSGHPYNQNVSPKHSRSKLAIYVGERIRQIRKRKRWGQAELGRRCRVGEKRVSEIERGVKAMNLATLEGVAAALDVDPYVLLLPDVRKPLDKPHCQSREMLGFLQGCDDRSRDFLWQVMATFAGYRADQGK